MAAPHVAGVAATVVALGVTDPDAVEAILKASASRPANGSTDANLYGAGIVNVQSAAREVLLRHGISPGCSRCCSCRRCWARASVSATGSSPSERSFGLCDGRWGVLSAAAGVAPHPWGGPRHAPAGEWDAVLAGADWHRWLPLANAGVVIGLVGLGFGRKSLRSAVGGVALGAASYLVATAVLGDTAGPFGPLRPAPLDRRQRPGLPLDRPHRDRQEIRLIAARYGINGQRPAIGVVHWL